jgi:hypothetical protein
MFSPKLKYLPWDPRPTIIILLNHNENIPTKLVTRENNRITNISQVRRERPNWRKSTDNRTRRPPSWAGPF